MNYEQFQDQLHEDALNLMSKFDDKYNMDNTLSLDEYLNTVIC